MLEVEWAGRVDYAAAWECQKDLVAARAAGRTHDRLLLLEHPPVYTLGRGGHAEHLLFDDAERRRRGIDLHWIDRGGDVTYHGPGQLVGYPILDLKQLHRRQGRERPDLHLYLRQLEEAIIHSLADSSIAGWRFDGYTGVWVSTVNGPRKIAAIGIKVSAKGISSHGFALNVDPDMSHFDGIVPCGIDQYGVTSMVELLEQPVSVADVIPSVVAAFGEVFQVQTRMIELIRET